MKFRRLEQWEHKKTRPLYEEVFREDDRRFVDYYYEWKTRDNVIYVAEDDDGIHAMVHLNPFRVFAEGQIQTLHYIVAVATQEEYRHRGLMRQLLQMAEREMAAAGERLTFLMPASEAIYLPFGYRFFGWQRTGIWRPRESGGPREGCGADCRPPGETELKELARFVNETLAAQFKLFVYRDAAYYERLCEEQRCQGGSVMAVVRGDRIIGTFCTARTEDGSEYSYELRELILSETFRAEALEAVRAYVNAHGACRVAGCQSGVNLEQEALRPLMMGKVPGGGSFENPWSRAAVFLNEVV